MLRCHFWVSIQRVEADPPCQRGGAGYFADASVRSTVATVLSQAKDSVAVEVVTLTNPIVNCSTEESDVFTVIGTRITSNFAS